MRHDDTSGDRQRLVPVGPSPVRPATPPGAVVPRTPTSARRRPLRRRPFASRGLAFRAAGLMLAVLHVAALHLAGNGVGLAAVTARVGADAPLAPQHLGRMPVRQFPAGNTPDSASSGRGPQHCTSGFGAWDPRGDAAQAAAGALGATSQQAAGGGAAGHAAARQGPIAYGGAEAGRGHASRVAVAPTQALVMPTPNLGLGNRLRSLSCVAILAAGAGRHLEVDWHPSPACNAELGDLFDVDATAGLRVYDELRYGPIVLSSRGGRHVGVPAPDGPGPRVSGTVFTSHPVIETSDNTLDSVPILRRLQGRLPPGGLDDGAPPPPAPTHTPTPATYTRAHSDADKCAEAGPHRTSCTSPVPPADPSCGGWSQATCCTPPSTSSCSARPCSGPFTFPARSSCGRGRSFSGLYAPCRGLNRRSRPSCRLASATGTVWPGEPCRRARLAAKRWGGGGTDRASCPKAERVAVPLTVLARGHPMSVFKHAGPAAGRQWLSVSTCAQMLSTTGPSSLHRTAARSFSRQPPWSCTSRYLTVRTSRSPRQHGGAAQCSPPHTRPL